MAQHYAGTRQCLIVTSDGTLSRSRLIALRRERTGANKAATAW